MRKYGQRSLFLGKEVPLKLRDVERWYWNYLASEVGRARHYLDLANRSYSRRIEEAKGKGDWKEAEELESEWYADVDREEADYEAALSRYWVRRAVKYRVPTPDHQDPKYWEKNTRDGRYNLTVAGIDDIEKRIDEKRVRSARIFLARVTPLVGLVGALTGLAAVVLAHLK